MALYPGLQDFWSPRRTHTDQLPSWWSEDLLGHFPNSCLYSPHSCFSCSFFPDDFYFVFILSIETCPVPSCAPRPQFLVNKTHWSVLFSSCSGEVKSFCIPYKGRLVSELKARNSRSILRVNSKASYLLRQCAVLVMEEGKNPEVTGFLFSSWHWPPVSLV